MVSNRDLMKEVLMTQGEIFADRPDFKRYHLIFNGDRENCKCHSLLSLVTTLLCCNFDLFSSFFSIPSLLS